MTPSAWGPNRSTADRRWASARPTTHVGIPSPPLDDVFWGGPPLHGLTLQGELSEWSVDAIGWAGEVLADVAASVGIRRSLLLSITHR